MKSAIVVDFWTSPPSPFVQMCVLKVCKIESFLTRRPLSEDVVCDLSLVLSWLARGMHGVPRGCAKD